ncbi:hypothetical protein FWK35_00009697 [Aphis craccivora]|uniref:Uncharacterized protein n=1 Tax=Aphis craccivora TaxID=307492 RepID=A0A6G0YX25_APHCR|nr:hypothetical protein FWK35_00009697 [Aphis craccivora]
MTSTKCFLGCISVRCGTRIISILDFNSKLLVFNLK